MRSRSNQSKDPYLAFAIQAGAVPPRRYKGHARSHSGALQDLCPRHSLQHGCCHAGTSVPGCTFPMPWIYFKKHHKTYIHSSGNGVTMFLTMDSFITTCIRALGGTYFLKMKPIRPVSGITRCRQMEL